MKKLPVIAIAVIAILALAIAAVVMMGGGDTPADPLPKAESDENGTATCTKDGDSYIFSATPSSELYSFVNWTDSSGNVVSTEATFISSATGDIKYKANFERKAGYVQIITEAGANGSVTDIGIVIIGTEVILNATPANGYELDAWTLPDGSTVANGYTFAASEDMVCKATFKILTFTINIHFVLPEHADSKDENQSFNLNYGEEKTLNAPSFENYEFVEWAIDGKTVKSTVLIIGPVKSNISVECKYVSTITYSDVTFVIGDAESTQQYADGQNVKLWAPNIPEGKTAVWKDADGNILNIGEYYETSISENTTFNLTYVNAKATVQMFYARSNSEVTTLKPVEFNFGEEINLSTIAPPLEDGTTFMGYFRTNSDHTLFGSEINAQIRLLDEVLYIVAFHTIEANNITASLDTSSSENATYIISMDHFTGISYYTIEYIDNDGTSVSSGNIIPTSTTYVYALDFESALDTTITVNVRYSGLNNDLEIFSKEIHVRHLSWNYLTVNGDLDKLATTTNNYSASIFFSIPEDLHDSYVSSDVPKSAAWSHYDALTAPDSVTADIVNKLEPYLEGLDQVDALNCILKMTQSIPYKYDDKGTLFSGGSYDYWNYPVETLWDMMGDCEDHAFLYASLARALGFDSALTFIVTPGGGHEQAFTACEQLDELFKDEIATYDSSNLCYYFSVSDGTIQHRFYFVQIDGVNYYSAESTPSMGIPQGKQTNNTNNIGYMPSGNHIYTSNGAYSRLGIVKA